MLDTFIGRFFCGNRKGNTCIIRIVKEEFSIADVCMRIISIGIIACICESVGCIPILILDHAVAAVLHCLRPYKCSIIGSLIIVHGEGIIF